MPDQKEKNRKLNAELSRALMNDVERLELGFATYWRQIAVVAVIAAIVVALVFWGFSHSRRTAREAAFTLADASTVTELAAALDKYGDQPGAAAARFRLAKLRIDVKEYDAALARAVNPDRQSTAAWCRMAQSLLLALESGDFGPYKPAAKL